MKQKSFYKKLQLLFTVFGALFLAFVGWLAYLGTNGNNVKLDYELSGTTRFAVAFNPDLTKKDQVIEAVNKIENDVADYAQKHQILFFDNHKQLLDSINNNDTSVNNRWYSSWNDPSHTWSSFADWPWALIFAVDTGTFNVTGYDSTSPSECMSNASACKQTTNTDIKSTLLKNNVNQDINNIINNDLVTFKNKYTDLFHWNVYNDASKDADWHQKIDKLIDDKNFTILYRVTTNKSAILNQILAVSLNFLAILIFVGIYIFIRGGWGTGIALVTTYICYFILSNAVLLGTTLYISYGSWVVSLVGLILLMALVLTFTTQYRSFFKQRKAGTKLLTYKDVEKDTLSTLKLIMWPFVIMFGFVAVVMITLLIIHLIDGTALSYQWKYILNVELYGLLTIGVVAITFALFLLLFIPLQTNFLNRRIKYMLEATNWKDYDKNEEEEFKGVNDILKNEDKPLDEIENPFLKPKDKK